MGKNILLTTMSLTTEGKVNIYYRNDKYCLGVLSTEPGSIYILSEYPIDKIVAIGTNKTLEKAPKSDVTWLDKYKASIESFLQQKGFEDYKDKVEGESKKEKVNEIFPDKMMVPDLRNVNKEIEICFVNEQQENGEYNIKEIVDALYRDDEKEINLYIDIQGGSRTSGYVRNAALSILCSQHPDKIHIKEMVATNYYWENVENEIVDEYDRYRIMDLVSGMNAFIQYGKADMIKNYCDAQGAKIDKNSSVAELVQYMVEIDNAISLCNMTELTNTIKNLKTLFDKFKEQDNKEVSSFVDNIFDILQDGIKKDYGKLVESDDFDNLELISWCRRKGFIQQALTLIEDKMPEVYIGEKGSGKVITYEFINCDDKEGFFGFLGQRWEKKENKIFYSLERYGNKKKVLSDQRIKDYCTGLSGAIRNVEQDELAVLRSKYFELSRETDTLRHSILKCCGQKDYRLIQKADNEITIRNATISVKINHNIDEEKLRQLFFLHKLLKQERNACNHASEDDKRLSADTVKGLIKLYVEKAEEIMKKVI